MKDLPLFKHGITLWFENVVTKPSPTCNHTGGTLK